MRMWRAPSSASVSANVKPVYHFADSAHGHDLATGRRGQHQLPSARASGLACSGRESS
jgi:hypothetical protein